MTEDKAGLHTKRKPVGSKRLRCRICGMMHRYMFPTDGLDRHTPTAVACANSLIGLIEDLLGTDCPATLVSGLTNMAYAVDSGGWRKGKKHDG